MTMQTVCVALNGQSTWCAFQDFLDFLLTMTLQVIIFIADVSKLQAPQSLPSNTILDAGFQPWFDMITISL